MRSIKKDTNNYILGALLDFVWGIEIGLLCIVFDYFIILNILDKLRIPCESYVSSACPQSTAYYCLYYFSTAIHYFAVIFPIFMLIKTLITYKNKKTNKFTK